MSARASMVRLAHAGAVTTLTLARPAKRNALVPDLLLDLCVALEQIGRRSETRAVVFAAEGVSFSIGGDIGRVASDKHGAALQTYAAELVGLLNQAIVSLLCLRQPVVAAVHGDVGGGSLGFLLASDLVVMADDAVAEANYAGDGVTPDGGWTALLPRLIGARRAAACLLLGGPMTARQAFDWGLVNVLVERGQVGAEAHAAAERIAAAPPVTMQTSKRLLAQELAQVEAALEAERRSFVAAVGRPRQDGPAPGLVAGPVVRSAERPSGGFGRAAAATRET
ncbi:MAG: enoyl-CoA hydratase/isomerase family protein [Limnobacter sp.]|nr:enoyl-CoA hydratase/isomerase family protein [Limnobacter sp.]